MRATDVSGVQSQYEKVMLTLIGPRPFSSSSRSAIVIVALVCATTPSAAQMPPWEPTAAQAQAATIVPEYAAFLGSLDPSDTTSVVRARAELVTRYAKATMVQKDAAFRQFSAFVDRAWWQLSPAFFSSPPARLLGQIPIDYSVPASIREASYGTVLDRLMRSTDAAMARLRTEHATEVAALKQYRAAGFRFSLGEGDWYLTQDVAFLAAAATDLKLGDLAAWTRFKAEADRQLLADDASLQLTWDDLRVRIARWETFARTHRALPEAATDVEPHVRWMVSAYVFGLPNTPAYGHEAKAIDPALKASYSRFLRENRESAYYQVIDGIMRRLVQHNGRPTEELVWFLKSKLTDPLSKDWIRSLETRLARK